MIFARLSCSSQIWRGWQLPQVSVTVLLSPASPFTQWSRRERMLCKAMPFLSYLTERGVEPLWAGLPEGWRALFLISAAWLVALTSAVRAKEKAVHPKIFLLDSLVYSRHWEDLSLKSNLLDLVMLHMLLLLPLIREAEEYWPEKNTGTLPFFTMQPKLFLTPKEKIPCAMICRSEIVRLEPSIHRFPLQKPWDCLIHFKEVCLQFSLYLAVISCKN